MTQLSNVDSWPELGRSGAGPRGALWLPLRERWGVLLLAALAGANWITTFLLDWPVVRIAIVPAGAGVHDIDIGYFGVEGALFIHCAGAAAVLVAAAAALAGRLRLTVLVFAVALCGLAFAALLVVVDEVDALRLAAVDQLPLGQGSRLLLVVDAGGLVVDGYLVLALLALAAILLTASHAAGCRLQAMAGVLMIVVSIGLSWSRPVLEPEAAKGIVSDLHLWQADGAAVPLILAVVVGLMTVTLLSRPRPAALWFVLAAEAAIMTVVSDFVEEQFDSRAAALDISHLSGFSDVDGYARYSANAWMKSLDSSATDTGLGPALFDLGFVVLAAAFVRIGWRAYRHERASVASRSGGH